MYRILHTYLPM